MTCCQTVSKISNFNRLDSHVPAPAVLPSICISPLLKRACASLNGSCGVAERPCLSMVSEEKLCAWHSALREEIDRRGGDSHQVPSLCAAEQNFFVDALEFAVSALLGL
jgi:hypothetical protein